MVYGNNSPVVTCITIINIVFFVVMHNTFALSTQCSRSLVVRPCILEHLQYCRDRLAMHKFYTFDVVHCSRIQANVLICSFQSNDLSQSEN